MELLCGMSASLLGHLCQLLYARFSGWTGAVARIRVVPRSLRRASVVVFKLVVDPVAAGC